jgi:hypothetical protein
MTVRTVETPKYAITIQNNGRTVSVDSGKAVEVYQGGVVNPIRPLKTVTADYAITAADWTILCDCSSGNITITLGSFRERVFNIKKTDDSVNKVILDPAASATIDGATTQELTLQYECLTVQCDASGNYHVL